MLKELEDLIQCALDLSLVTCSDRVKNDPYLKADMNRNIDLVIANLQMIKQYNSITSRRTDND